MQLYQCFLSQHPEKFTDNKGSFSGSPRVRIDKMEAVFSFNERTFGGYTFQEFNKNCVSEREITILKQKSQPSGKLGLRLPIGIIQGEIS